MTHKLLDQIIAKAKMQSPGTVDKPTYRLQQLHGVLVIHETQLQQIAPDILKEDWYKGHSEGKSSLHRLEYDIRTTPTTSETAMALQQQMLASINVLHNKITEAITAAQAKLVKGPGIMQEAEDAVRKAEAVAKQHAEVEHMLGLQVQLTSHESKIKDACDDISHDRSDANFAYRAFMMGDSFIHKFEQSVQSAATAQDETIQLQAKLIARITVMKTEMAKAALQPSTDSSAKVTDTDV